MQCRRFAAGVRRSRLSGSPGRTAPSFAAGKARNTKTIERGRTSLGTVTTLNVTARGRLRAELPLYWKAIRAGS
jgi:hypothetical protein